MRHAHTVRQVNIANAALAWRSLLQRRWEARWGAETARAGNPIRSREPHLSFHPICEPISLLFRRCCHPLRCRGLCRAGRLLRSHALRIFRHGLPSSTSTSRRRRNGCPRDGSSPHPLLCGILLHDAPNLNAEGNSATTIAHPKKLACTETEEKRGRVGCCRPPAPPASPTNRKSTAPCLSVSSASASPAVRHLQNPNPRPVQSPPQPCDHPNPEPLAPSSEGGRRV
jgi:hypothetical protein